MNFLLERLRHFNELVMFQHTVFALPFILIAMIVGAGGWFGWKLLFLGLLCAVSARNFAMAFNRLVDRDIDAKNPRTRTRPSVDGRVSVREMTAFILLNGVLFVFSAFWINHLAFALSLPILLILALYSVMKRFSFLAHLLLGVSLALAPIAGIIAIKASVPLWSVFLSLGVLFWVAGFDVLYSLQDREFDKAAGLHSIPVYFGESRAIWIARGFHLITLVFWLLFVHAAPVGILMLWAWACCAVMLFYEHYLVSRDFENIPRAFFTVNGYLGILFLLFCVMDAVL
ncbi:MAG: menaquinone biosynthesis prenyltransferase MqnP [Wolinella sp.]